jgi:hypothetical protein
MANQPEQKFQAGAVQATVWRNEGKTKDGKDFNFLTVSVQRGYKDKDGNWQNTTALRTNDVPRAQLVLTQAWEYINTKEKTEETKEGD